VSFSPQLVAANGRQHCCQGGVTPPPWSRRRTGWAARVVTDHGAYRLPFSSQARAPSLRRSRTFWRAARCLETNQPPIRFVAARRAVAPRRVTQSILANEPTYDGHCLRLSLDPGRGFCRCTEGFALRRGPTRTTDIGVDDALAPLRGSNA